MAEPIGIASGLLAIATFAFQSSITLYQTVQSFQNHPKVVRNLKEELEALNVVLDSLIKTVKATTDVDLSALDFPLRQCGRACKGCTALSRMLRGPAAWSKVIEVRAAARGGGVGGQWARCLAVTCSRSKGVNVNRRQAQAKQARNERL